MSGVVDGVNVDVSIDSKKVEEALDRMSGKELDKLIKRALGKASSTIVRKSKKELRKVANGKSKYSNAIHGWNLIKNRKGQVVGVRSLEQGIRSKWHKSNSMYKINIMADWRLRFFEGGTSARSYKTKNGKSHSTGKIKDSHFFTKAIKQSQSEVSTTIDTIVSTNLKIIWDANYAS